MPLRARWVALLVLLASLLLPLGRASAAPSVEVRAADRVLPFPLVFREGTFSGKLEVENRGAEPVNVEASLRSGGELDPRLPAGLSVKLANGGAAAMLQAGQKRELVVEWALPRGARAHELYGHILVSVAGEAAPRAFGFHLAMPAAEAGLGGHLLSLLFGVPLLLGLVLLALRGREPRSGSARLTVAAAGLGQLLLLAWASSRFDVSFNRFLGSDGLQLIERIPLSRTMGLEWFLALDGISLVLGTIAPALTLVVAFGSTRAGELAKSGGLVLLLNAGLTGALFSFDLALFVTFWLLAVVGAVLLVLFAEGNTSRAGRGVAVQLGLGLALVGAAVWQLSQSGATSYLLDGTAVARSFNLVDLSHGGFQPAVSSWLGVHPVKAVYALLFLGCAVTMGVPPFQSWLGAALQRVSAPVGAMLAGGIPLLGVYGILRVGYAALPTGSAWAAPAVAIFGVVAALFAALSMVGARSLSSLVAGALASHAALTLVALASLTAIGLQATVLLSVSRALFGALLLLVVAELRARHGTLAIAELSGLWRTSPLFGVLAAVGFAAAAGAPGTLTFLGQAAAVAGALPTRQVAVLLAPIVVVVSAVALGRAFFRVFLGEGAAPAATEAEELDPRVPLALAVSLLVLGLWPRPITQIADAACLDQAEHPNPPGVFEVVELDGTPDERTAQR